MPQSHASRCRTRSHRIEQRRRLRRCQSRRRLNQHIQAALSHSRIPQQLLPIEQRRQGSPHRSLSEQRMSSIPQQTDDLIGQRIELLPATSIDRGLHQIRQIAQRHPQKSFGLTVTQQLKTFGTVRRDHKPQLIGPRRTSPVARKLLQRDVTAALPLGQTIRSGADRLAIPRLLHQASIGKVRGRNDRQLRQRVQDLGRSPTQIDVNALVSVLHNPRNITQQTAGLWRVVFRRQHHLKRQLHIVRTKRPAIVKAHAFAQPQIQATTIAIESEPLGQHAFVARTAWRLDATNQRLADQIVRNAMSPQIRLKQRVEVRGLSVDDQANRRSRRSTSNGRSEEQIAQRPQRQRPNPPANDPAQRPFTRARILFAMRHGGTLAQEHRPRERQVTRNDSAFPDDQGRTT